MPSLMQQPASPTVLQTISFLQSSLQQFQGQAREICVENLKPVDSYMTNTPPTPQLNYSIFKEIIPLIWKGGKGLEQRTEELVSKSCALDFLVLNYVC